MTCATQSVDLYTHCWESALYGFGADNFSIALAPEGNPIFTCISMSGFTDCMVRMYPHSEIKVRKQMSSSLQHRAGNSEFRHVLAELFVSPFTLSGELLLITKLHLQAHNGPPTALRSCALSCLTSPRWYSAFQRIQDDTRTGACPADARVSFLRCSILLC